MVDVTSAKCHVSNFFVTWRLGILDPSAQSVMSSLQGNATCESEPTGRLRQQDRKPMIWFPAPAAAEPAEAVAWPPAAAGPTARTRLMDELLCSRKRVWLGILAH